MKWTTLRKLSICLVSLIGMTRWAAAQTPESTSTTAFRKSVKLPAESRAEFTSVPLDRELYSGTTESWNDLRLLDSKEKEVPFLLHRQVKEERKSQRTLTAIAQPQVRPLEDNRLEIIFTIDRKKHPHSIDGITLATRLRDFEHRVSVETRTSDDTPWRSLVNDAIIYDYSRYMDVRNLDIPFAEKSLSPEETTFRILIEQVTQDKESQFRELTRSLKDGATNDVQEKLMINRDNLKLDGVSYWHDVETIVSSVPVLTDYTVEVQTRKEDEKSKQTIIEFTSQREPLSQLELTTEDKNFHRVVTLYSLGETASLATNAERYLTQSSITQISLPNSARSDLLIKFPATRSTRYRLVIANGDSPPLKDLNIRAKGETVELLFLAQPNEQYSVVYGNLLLDAPAYDTLAIKTALDLKLEPTLASLDPANTYAITDPRSEWEKILENRWLLGGLFATLILILGLTLFQASKRLSSISP